MERRGIHYTVKRLPSDHNFFIAEISLPDPTRLSRRQFHIGDQTQAYVRRTANQWCKDRIDDFLNGKV